MLKKIFNRTGMRIGKSIIKNRLSIPTPFFAIWAITSACNMKCSFCNRWKYPNLYSKGDLNTKEVCDLISQCADLGVGVMNFHGGEPLVRKDMGKILRYAKKEHIITSVNTNGYFLSERMDDIQKYTDYLRVSIDSIKIHNRLRGTKNAFENAVDGIRAARERGIDVIIHSVISNKTIDEMGDLAALADKLDCNITFSKIFTSNFPVGEKYPAFTKKESVKWDVNNIKFVKNIRELKKRYPNVVNPEFHTNLVEAGGVGTGNVKCKAADVVVGIRADGDIVFPCEEYPIKKFSTKNKTLKEIWHSKGVNKIRRDMDSYKFCKGCSIECYLFPSMLTNSRNILSFLNSWRRI